MSLPEHDVYDTCYAIIGDCFFLEGPSALQCFVQFNTICFTQNAAGLDSQIQIEYDRIIPGFFRKDISYKLNKLNFMKIKGSQQV